MADVKFGNHLDLSNYELRNAKLHVVGTLPTPTAGMAGRVVYLSSDGRPYVCNGSGWQLKATDSDALGGNTSAYHLSRANHTGTQTASTISNFTTAVQAIPVSTLSPATGPLPMGGQKITSLGAGTASTDAATYGQLLAFLNNQDFKASARVASVADRALTGLTPNVDGIVLAAGDRVLLKNQTNAQDNGVWVAATGAWTRAVDADTDSEVTPGMVVPVEEGVTQDNTLWMLTTNGPITLGTTALSFANYGAMSGEILTGGAGLVKTGTVMDVGAGTGIVVNANDVAIDTALVVRKKIFTFGDGAATSFVLNHNLNTRDVHVSVRDAATPYSQYIVGVDCTDLNNVTLTFAVAPAAASMVGFVTG